ncbi:MAG TPA: hypothetical protein VJS11_11290 [Acidobacteriaceae bacterium]|nr:hypothetical protein [Acidobacteriaceae bacterium]
MDAIAFKSLVVSRFPALRDDFEEWRDLVHLQISEFLSFTQSAIEAGSLDVVAQCFEIATAALREGDEDLRNAIFVSYLEPLDLRSYAGKRAEELMPLELTQARYAVLNYDEQLLGRKLPTDER